MIPARLVDLAQRLSRRLDTGALEQVHQRSYLELARRTPWLNDVPLASTGGGTASFSLLFVLLSILRDAGIAAVLELGVGHSTRLFAQWALAAHGTVLSVEHDRLWLERVAVGSPGITATHAPLTATVVAGRHIRWYDTPRPQARFDLLLVDGPPSWSRPRRFDRLGILEWLPEVLADEFILVVDDASRPGERLLVRQLERCLERAGRHAACRTVCGWSSQTIFATPRFASCLYL